MLYGGEGVEFYLGVKNNGFGTWQEEHDKNSPAEVLVDLHLVEEYEFNYIVIDKYLPWVRTV